MRLPSARASAASLVWTAARSLERRRPKSASSCSRMTRASAWRLADHSASARLLQDAAVVGDQAAQLLEHGDGPVEGAEAVAEDRRGLVEVGEDLRARVDVVARRPAAARRAAPRPGRRGRGRAILAGPRLAGLVGDGAREHLDRALGAAGAQQRLGELQHDGVRSGPRGSLEALGQPRDGLGGLAPGHAQASEARRGRRAAARAATTRRWLEIARSTSPRRCSASRRAGTTGGRRGACRRRPRGARRAGRGSSASSSGLALADSTSVRAASDGSWLGCSSRLRRRTSIRPPRCSTMPTTRAMSRRSSSLRAGSSVRASSWWRRVSSSG
jgi:hypothetical protein